MRVASERLRELYDLPVLEKYETDLFQHLPLIADVVEAAERLHERVEMDESVGICLSERVESLRAGAALTALRDSLEEK